MEWHCVKVGEKTTGPLPICHLPACCGPSGGYYIFPLPTELLSIALKLHPKLKQLVLRNHTSLRGFDPHPKAWKEPRNGFSPMVLIRMD